MCLERLPVYHLKLLRTIYCNALIRNRLGSLTSRIDPFMERRIRQETQITQNHLTPEISLYLITEECPLFHQPYNQSFPNDPFWAFYWPGGQAISRYILDHPEIVNNRRVLDIGSGCGASSIAALLSKAEYSIANDIDDLAGCAAVMNAQLNAIDLERLLISSENLIGTNVTADVLLVGDLFYDEEIAEHLLPWLRRLVAEGKTILIGDPGRHGLTENTQKYLHKLATYPLREKCCIENNGFRYANVWKLKMI